MNDGSEFDSQFERKVPEGDERERRVCRNCGWIDYENPKIIVGSVCEWDGKVLLCRRAIEPRYGFWTLPAGFMELQETTEQGAAREAYEEALAEIEVLDLLAIYSIPRISQVHMIYRATLRKPKIGVGPESLEVRMFAWEEIPWDELAFPNNQWALEQYRSVQGQVGFAPFGVPEAEQQRMSGLA